MIYINNFNLEQLIQIASKLNKDDLKKAIEQANNIIDSKDKENIIDKLKKNLD